MKATVDAASFGRAVEWAAGHTGSTLPILSAVVLTATEDGTLVASGGDDDSWVEQAVEAHVATAGKVAVSGRLAKAVAGAMDGDGRVDLAADGTELAVTAGRLRASLPLMPVEDYPARPPMPDRLASIRLPAGLGRALAAAAPVAAGLEDESKGSHCGCELALEPDGVRVTAVSRYRVFTAVLPWPAKAGRPAGPCALPLAAASVKAMAEVLGDDGDGDGRLGLPEAGQNVVAVSCGGRTLGCRLSGLPVPEWRRFLAAKPAARSLAVDAAELAGLVKRLRPTNDAKDALERRHLRVDIGSGALRLSTPVASDAVEVALDGPWDTDPWPMLIDSGYLMDVVTAADAETLRIDFTSPKQAWRVTRPGSNAFDSAVMPIRI